MDLVDTVDLVDQVKRENYNCRIICPSIIKRKKERFSGIFRYKLTEAEAMSLRSRFATLKDDESLSLLFAIAINSRELHRKFQPDVFIEQEFSGCRKSRKIHRINRK